MYYAYAATPVGELLLGGDGTVLQAMYWMVYRYTPAPQADWVEDASQFQTVLTQLDEYFAGNRQVFDIPTLAQGTLFQKRIWQELSKIKYGETRSYRQIADAAGYPQAVRAVGAAIGRNPLAIVVPCHRVIASNGNLTGFAGGIESKRTLLRHEGAAAQSPVPLPQPSSPGAVL